MADEARHPFGLHGLTARPGRREKPPPNHIVNRLICLQKDNKFYYYKPIKLNSFDQNCQQLVCLQKIIFIDFKTFSFKVIAIDMTRYSNFFSLTMMTISIIMHFLQ